MRRGATMLPATGPALLALGGLAVVLGGLIGVELMPDARLPAEQPLAPEAPHHARSLPSVARGVTARYAASSLARPLFSPDRRPPAGPHVVAGVPSAPEFPRLAGIMVGPAGSRAIFAPPPPAKPIVVEEGGRVAGFVVRSIATEAVTLASPDGERVVRPSFAKSTEPARMPGFRGAPLGVPNGRLSLPLPALRRQQAGD